MRPRRWFRLLALFAVLGLIAAGCGEDDEGDDEQTSTSDFKACQVTDTGGIDDRSFNQTAYAGIERAQEELGIEGKVLESTAETDFEPNINAFLEEDCDLIVTVGFLLGDATDAAAEANPDQKFAIVDYDFFDTEAEEDITHDNVEELTFATDEAAFLAGYLAAGVTETGKVGTYGGLNIPTVTIFMDGFLAGVNKYNEENDTEIEVLGWDGSDGLFTGDFENQDNGRNTTENLIDEGADIILPVAGPVGLGSVEAARSADGVKLIWVDTDGCVSVPDACDLFLTSIQKNMDTAVFDAIDSAFNDNFEGGLYVGTLENGGVDIAGYNELEDEVPDELKQQVDTYKEQIISGELTVGE